MINPYYNLKEYENNLFAYKEEFCPLFNLEYKVGKAKDLQLNQLGQYMDISKENRKIRLNKIYDDNEIQIIENRGKYLTHIENFLIILLSTQAKKNKKYVVLTNRNILEMAMMVNDNYFKGMWNMFQYADKFDLHINKADKRDEEEYYEMNEVLDKSNIFFSASYRLFKRIIYDCLTSMEKQSLILKNKTYVCYKPCVNIFGKKDTEVIECNNDMKTRILSVQHASVKEFNELAKDDNGKQKYFLKNVDSTYMLYHRQRQEFKDLLRYNFQQEFKEEGYDNYSRAWKLNLGDSVTFEEELKTRKFDGIKLNHNVREKLNNAKDLRAISDVLRRQFISTFITKNTLSTNFAPVVKNNNLNDKND